jgi:hypothetical protein
MRVKAAARVLGLVCVMTCSGAASEALADNVALQWNSAMLMDLL